MPDTEDLLGNGNVKVTYLTSLSSISLPPADELNAGTDLQRLILSDGLGIEPDQAAVDTTSLASKSDTERGGSATYKIQLMCKIKKVKAENIAFNTLQPGEEGYLAVRRDKDEAIPWAADDDAEIYPVECGIRMKQQTARNAVQKFSIKMFNYDDANVDAVVAA